ncbi:phosphoribosylformylglycinamidine synthase II [Pyrolobus fumarii 1A]|uniref:Phosphoribosylformylglycinamidine synthase subunit PurL n=1 Tax=Pyrolobus fumarii (strain DSM 11204 / 1A) TaxID=694429 RepID=G0EGU7_PYRF1|nr:phosphoribosylformylglycinamidine synthase subunit PurL [Pyrolobus fumarii]AEM39245.1 phosphoribosylformylglycinamidine synthase II [Pyrolobus fumarii 1A]
MPLSREELEYARKLLGREPTRAELIVLEAVWSEHCSYKSSRRWLRLLPSEGRDVVLGPGRDAAVVKAWDDLYIAFRIESHNHPSAVDPYNGAATGVGGIVRDILSVGAKPIALLDILYLGEPGVERSDWLAKGIVRGISDYGNRIGVPTVAGETWRLPWYNKYPLVNVACVGILEPRELLPGRVEPGDPIVIVGSATGRDGLLGSSFASKPLEEDIAAVQVGNPFIEKLLIDAVRDAVEHGLVKHVKDLGGGGISVAIGETAYDNGVGAEVHLDKLHLREPDMTPEEILASESQERMLLVPHRGELGRLLKLLESYGLEYSVIGEFSGEKRIRFLYRGDTIVDLPLEAFRGPPEPPRESRQPSSLPDTRLVRLPEPSDYRDVFLKVLSSPNVGSRRWVYERYDWGVQGRAVLPPGHGDAAVLWVYEADGYRGIAVSGDGNPRYTRVDPYRGAALALEEAYRNVVTVGAAPIAAVDNINAGNPEKPEQYWFFEQMVRGLAWAARELGTPIVGGNVSLYNEDPETGMVNPVTSIVVVGRVEDVRRVYGLAPREKLERYTLLLVGADTLPELGASEYLHVVHGRVEGAPPEPRPSVERLLANYMSRLSALLAKLSEDDNIDYTAYAAAHDVSNGGLAVAATEMALAANMGFELELDKVPSRGCRGAHEILFSETQARLLLALHPDAASAAAKLARELGLRASIVGALLDTGIVRVTLSGKTLVEVDVDNVRGVYGEGRV